MAISVGTVSNTKRFPVLSFILNKKKFASAKKLVVVNKNSKLYLHVNVRSTRVRQVYVN